MPGVGEGDENNGQQADDFDAVIHERRVVIGCFMDGAKVTIFSGMASFYLRDAIPGGVASH